MKRVLVYEVANLREGLVAEFDSRQIGTLWAIYSSLKPLQHSRWQIGPL